MVFKRENKLSLTMIAYVSPFSTWVDLKYSIVIKHENIHYEFQRAVKFSNCCYFINMHILK